MIGPGPIPASASRPLKTVSSDYTVQPSDGTIEADASGGSLTITFPLGLGSSASAASFRVSKVDETGNVVQISDGTRVIDLISAPATTDGQVNGWRDVYSNGTSLRSLGVG